MKSLKNFKRLLINCLQRNNLDVRELIKTYAITNGYAVIEESLFIVAMHPDIVTHRLPLIAAHYDTVRKNDEIIVAQKGDIFVNSKNDALGGDDRCGVAIALALIQEHTRGIFCFFDEEETGCGGSTAMIKMYSTYIKECTCYIGLDRAHNLDAATYSYRSEKLLAVVGKYGYKEVMGSLTDVSNIEDTYPKATVNLSVGFNNQHSSKESVNVKHSYATYEAMIAIAEECVDKAFDDIESTSFDSGYSYSGYGYGGYKSFGKEVAFYDDDYDDSYYGIRDNKLRDMIEKNDSLPFGSSSSLSHVLAIEKLLAEKGSPAYREVDRICGDCPSLTEGFCTEGWECFSEDDLEYLQTANAYWRGEIVEEY